MKRLNLNSPQDFMALAVRRKLWILIPFLALSSAIILITFILPKGYVSQALIVIKPRDIPSDLVRNLLAGTTEERLSVIQQTVLGRETMVSIIQEFGEDLTDYKNLNNMDDKVSRLQHRIAFNFRGNDRSGSGQLPVTYFSIAFQDPDPKVAQKIAKKVMDLFIAQDNTAREEQVNGSKEFFNAEVEKLAALLKDSDTKLKGLKGSRRNELPSQVEPNLRNLESLRQYQSSLSDQIVTMETTLGQMQQVLATYPKELPKKVEPIAPTRAQLNPKVVEYRAKLAEKKALINKGDKETHPDVVTVNLALERLKQDMTPEEFALVDAKDEKESDVPAVAETIPNPNYENLQLTIDATKVQIGLKEQAIKRTETDIETIKKRLENAPTTEMALADVERENSDLNTRYKEMLAKYNQTELSVTLEGQQKEAQFKIINAPTEPQSATKPEKYVLAGGGMLVSLLVGLAFGILVDIANQKMWTISDVEALLGTTVLVEIPEIVTPADVVAARRKRLGTMASLVAVTVVYGVGLYLVYHHKGYVLTHLDPFIQRFYQ